MELESKRELQRKLTNSEKPQYRKKTWKPKEKVTCIEFSNLEKRQRDHLTHLL